MARVVLKAQQGFASSVFRSLDSKRFGAGASGNTLAGVA
jgi:hypothetical protein